MKNTVSLTQNRDFKRLYYRGGSAVTDLLVIYFSKNRLNKNRLGITVSKKLGGAVVRNRARRVVKECYRLSEDRIKKGYDIVLVVRSKAVGESFGRISASLWACLEKAKLSCSEKEA